MINLDKLNHLRLLNAAMESMGDKTCGAFEVPSAPCPGQILRVIASSSYGWDHVSVSLADRCPLWAEMEQIKRLFFSVDECVMQLHPPIADYVDGTFHRNCIYCLHLWRPHSRAIPRPPKYLVGGMTAKEADEAMRKDGFR